MALQDKTEPATPRRREEAREEGRVAKSADMNGAIVLLASLLTLKAVGPHILVCLTEIVRDTFANLHTHAVETDTIGALLGGYAVKAIAVCLPIMLAAGAAGLASNVLQIGFKVTSKPMALNLSKIDPLKGMARLVSWRSAVELIKSVLKIGVVAYVVYAFLRKEYPRIIGLCGLSPGAAGAAVAGLCWSLLARACAAMLVIAALDYMYQRIYFENSLKMTKQEVKDEYKRSEGDPHVKARILQRQRELARRRMMHDVPKADVVVTNPTHVAVALKYDPLKMSAPTVVAKGQRLLAERIKAIAEASGVPIVENVQIARPLYKLVEVGQRIPEELYQAVAEILAFVYRLSEKAGRAYRARRR